MRVNLPEWMETEIASIENDRVHGATYLTERSIRLVQKAAAGGASPDLLKEAALRIAASRPMMASVFNFANELLLFLESEESCRRCVEFCREYLLLSERFTKRAVVLAAETLPKEGTILTHSASTMVRDALLVASEAGARMRVWCTESRPGKEGVAFARSLCESGIETTLIIDAAAPFLLSEADMVLVGADGVGTFGLVHKIGTYAIALAAKRAEVAFVSVASGKKLWPSGHVGVVEPPKDGSELGAEGCLEALNLYFDVTPPDPGVRIVTEEGVLDFHEVRRRCEEMPLHPLLSSRARGSCAQPLRQL